jgi:hypothetical protein
MADRSGYADIGTGWLECSLERSKRETPPRR